VLPPRDFARVRLSLIAVCFSMLRLLLLCLRGGSGERAKQQDR